MMRRAILLAAVIAGGLLFAALAWAGAPTDNAQHETTWTVRSYR